MNKKHLFISTIIIALAVIAWLILKPTSNIEAENLAKSTVEKALAEAKQAITKVTNTTQDQESKPPAKLPDDAPITEKRFTFAGVDLPLIFEDKDLTEQQQLDIYADIVLIYGHFKEHQVYNREDKPNLVQLNQQEYQSIKTLSMKGKGRFFPDDYTKTELLGEGFPEGATKKHSIRPDKIVTIDNEDYLVVPKVLSDAYLEAFEFRDEHQEAFNAINEFVDYVSQGTKEELASYDLFWLYGYDGMQEQIIKLHGEEAYKNAEKQAEQIKQQYLDSNKPEDIYIKEPSVLEYYIFNESNAKETGLSIEALPENMLLANGFFTDENGVPENKVRYGYNKGKWSLIVIVGY